MASMKVRLPKDSDTQTKPAPILSAALTKRAPVIRDISLNRAFRDEQDDGEALNPAEHLTTWTCKYAQTWFVLLTLYCSTFGVLIARSETGREKGAVLFEHIDKYEPRNF